MAEGIGVAASGITIGALAIGIANSAIKLRSVWNQVQNAPDDVLYLIRDLEDLSYMLADSEEFQQRNAVSSLVLDSVPISRCLQRCKEEVDRLKELTDGLSSNLEHSSKFKKKWAAAKIVLNRDQINRYKDRLDRTLRALDLSHRKYMMALLQLLPDIIITKLSKSPKNAISGAALYGCSDLDRPSTSCLEVTDSDENASSGAVTPHYDQALSISSLFGRFCYRKHDYAIYKRGETIAYSKKQEIEERIAEYWTPPWIAHRLWRLRAFKALSGWTLCFQTYNIIPRYSLAFIYAQENNTKGLQELFSRKAASPFVCDPSGETLLFSAIKYGSLDTCRFLIEEDADPNYMYGANSALEYFEWCGRDTNDTSGLWRLLLAKTDREVDLRKYHGSSGGFSHWQQIVDPLFYKRPLGERLAVAFSMVRSLNRPDVVRRALSLGSLPPLTRAKRGDLLIHVAKWAGWTLSWANGTSTGSFAWSFDTWKPFLRELIFNGAPLHYIDATFNTPLLALLMTSIDALCDYENLAEARLFEGLFPSLSGWLESLQECGVSLEEYGEEEIDLHDQGKVSWSFCRTSWSYIVFLTALTYGYQPSDWKVTLECRDKETPYIPGGWIGDDDGDDEDYEDDSIEDEDEGDLTEDEEEDGSNGEVYEDCSVGDEPRILAQTTGTD